MIVPRRAGDTQGSAPDRTLLAAVAGVDGEVRAKAARDHSSRNWLIHSAVAGTPPKVLKCSFTAPWSRPS